MFLSDGSYINPLHVAMIPHFEAEGQERVGVFMSSGTLLEMTVADAVSLRNRLKTIIHVLSNH